MNYVNVASFADDNTPYVTGDGVIQLTESLKKSTRRIILLVCK